MSESLPLVSQTVSKVETQPEKRLGTGTLNEELKLREEGAPTQGRLGALPLHRAKSKYSYFQPHDLALFPLPTSGQQLGLALTGSPGLALPRMNDPHMQVTTLEPLYVATTGPRQDYMSCF